MHDVPEVVEISTLSERIELECDDCYQIINEEPYYYHMERCQPVCPSCKQEKGYRTAEEIV